MGFFSDIFGGLSNNFTPQGVTQALQQAGTANQNYAAANTGLGSLAAALQQQMTGGGPNLADAQLQSATAKNVANQAALAGGQRGAAGNVGLMARQIGQQGADIQQQAAGQSAQNVLAQQLAAQSQLGSVLGTQGGLANQNYGTAQNAINNANQVGAGIASENARMNQGLLGGAANALGSITRLFAKGGEADGPFSGFTGGNFGFNFVNGNPPGTKPAPAPTMINQGTMPGTGGTVGVSQRAGAGSGIRNLGGFDAGQGAAPMAPTSMIAGPMADPTAQPMAAGGMALPFAPRQAPSMVPNGQQGLAGGGYINAKRGGTVPGEPKYPGQNTVKQDTVPAMLTPKEIVLPLSVTQSDNPAQAAHDFVAKIKGGGSDQSEFKDALNRSIASRRKKSV